MTVIYNRGFESVDSWNILYSNQSAVKKLVTSMLIDAAEGNLNMVLDCSDEYPDKNSIESVFDTLNQQCIDRLEDVIMHLRDTMLEQLNTLKTTAKVTRIDYKVSGEVDDIHLKVDIA